MKKITSLTFLSITLLFSLLFSSPALAWNWVGHELVAQIAYDQLTPTEKAFWNKRIDAIRTVYPKENFIQVSTLPDDLRRRGINTYSSWHYIDLPVFLDDLNHSHYHLKKINPPNVIWAINKSLKIELDKSETAYQKAFYGSFLIHLVGDAHQPLHCAELYSADFPKGDLGGNLFYLKNRKYHNLHAYWDQGAGFLSWRLAKSKETLQATAYKLEKKYPKSWFGSRANNLDPAIWVQESHDLAEKKAYVGIKEYGSPSNSYKNKVESVTQEQIVLAGYRLAELLKQIII